MSCDTKIGSNNQSIGILQGYLQECDYYNGTIDDKYGSVTVAAVKG